MNNLETISTLEEMFEYFPINLEYRGQCSDYSIYSNEAIETKVLDEIRETSKIKEISDTVERGIKAKKILIGYTTPSAWGFMKRKFRDAFIEKTKTWFGWDVFGIYGSAETLGLFNKKDNMLAIMLDPNIRITGRTMVSIPATMMHELCHKVACDLTNEYLESQYSTLIPFYRATIKAMNDNIGVINEDRLRKTIRIITTISEKRFKPDLLGDVVNQWFLFFKSHDMSDEDATDAVYKMILPFFKYSIEEPIDGCPRELEERADEFLECFYIGYDEIGIRNTRYNTLAGQEGIFTSEVISIANETYPHSETIRLINKLKFD